MEFVYAASLLGAIACMGLIDYRYKLALFKHAKRTIMVLVIATGTFIVWDLLGIALGIFKRGTSKLSLGFELLPEFPLEEILFLILLCYCSLVIYLLVLKRSMK